MPRFVPGVGPKPCDLMGIGEGPGFFEDKQGAPFVGKSGRLLDFCVFKYLGITRDDMYLTNVVKQRCSGPDGKDRTPYPAEIKRDRPLLQRELLEVRPRTIFTLGRTATQWFLGDVDMEAVHGIPVRWGTQVIIPCYHPAAALHDQSGEIASLVHEDLRQVGRYLRGEVEARERVDQYPRPKYQLLKTGAEPGAWKVYDNLVFVDTEGLPGRPWSLQYTTADGLAFVIRANNRKLLDLWVAWVQKLGLTVVMHNALYDIGILRDMGIDLVALGIPFHDTMVMAYLDRLEPQGLKPLAYRHASMVMRSYEDLTDFYERRMYMEYLQQASGFEYPNPDPVLKVDSKTGEQKVSQPKNVRTRIIGILRDIKVNKLNKAGEPPHPRKRWEQIEEPLQQQVIEAVGPVPEFSLDLVPLEDAIEYGGRDADATCRIFPTLDEKIEVKDLRDCYEMKRAILPMVERMMHVGFMIDPQHFANMRADIAADQERIDLKLKKIAGKWINVDSSQQVADLLFRQLGLPSERLTKKGRVPSTDDKTLESLVGRHPAVGLIIERREVNTIDGFARDLPDFRHPDDRIRCTLRITRVAQGRLAASKPNLLGIPVRSHLGKRLRGGFVSPSGYHLGSADLSQIEMAVMADESGDETLVGQMQRGEDTHAKTAIDILGATEEQSKDPYYREPAKRVQFGIITGITEVGLYEQLRLNHIEGYSVADCAKMLEAYFRLRPGVARYINACRAEARRFGFVRDRWGMIRYLPGVWSDIPYVRSEAERQSHSHKISGTAQGIIQRAMKRIWQRLVDELWPAGIHCEILLQIHDEIIWEGEGEPGSWQSDLISGIIVEELLAESHLFKAPLKAKASVGLTWGELK